MAIFNSYVKLPEGIPFIQRCFATGCAGAPHLLRPYGIHLPRQRLHAARLRWRRRRRRGGASSCGNCGTGGERGKNGSRYPQKIGGLILNFILNLTKSQTYIWQVLNFGKLNLILNLILNFILNLDLMT